MSFRRSQSPHHRFSNDGFQRLNQSQKDVTVNIPMQQVMSNHDYGSSNEKQQLYNGGGFSAAGRGFRKSMLPGARTGGSGRRGYDGEEDTINNMGLIYKKILNFSIVTRYLVYYVPVAALLAIPVIIGATAAPEAKIGDVRIVWFFVWVECAWAGLWVSKIFAQFTPWLFTFLCGIVSSGTRKYSLVLKSLEIPLSLAGWALVSLATFLPIMQRNPDTRAENAEIDANNLPAPNHDWQYKVQRVLAAALIGTLILLGEKLLIQLISINYHRKQFAAKIKESKHNIWLLTLLYDASRTLFPAYCDEFVEEDAIINDSFASSRPHTSKKGGVKRRSGSVTPMRILRDVGRVGDKITSAFGNVAQEITGKQVFNPDGAHSVVVEALEKTSSCEALARRLWLSFVIEGQDALYHDDIAEVLGAERQAEAEEAFAALDRDGNGDVSLDEMILTVSQYSKDRHSIAKSMHDVDQAINVLDKMLSVVVFIAVIFVFVAFLNTTFVTTLATAGTALISLSFVFSVTCQEILGSCIFLFVKHPFDVGDRVDVNKEGLFVEKISLLFTVFRRVSSHQMVQIPNILLNTLWIENLSRSKAMREQLSIFVAFDTSFEDIQLLKNEIKGFVLDKDNCRDFQPDVEIEVLGINEMDKLELKVEILHKSNWANETIRAARRSKFMCALVLALRRVPIYGPAGSAAALGDASNPSYSVALNPEQASKNKDQAAAALDSKRLIPTKKDNSSADSSSALGPIAEKDAVDLLNQRSPSLDAARDEGIVRTPSGGVVQRSAAEMAELDQMRGLLKRESTRGKRKSGRSAGEELSSPNETSRPPQIGVTSPGGGVITRNHPDSSVQLRDPSIDSQSMSQSLSHSHSQQNISSRLPAPSNRAYIPPPPPAIASQQYPYPPPLRSTSRPGQFPPLGQFNEVPYTESGGPQVRHQARERPSYLQERDDEGT